MKPYDFFKISPDVYDMRKDIEGKERQGAGGAESPRKKKAEKDEGDGEKKKRRGEEEEEPEDPLGGKIAQI